MSKKHNIEFVKSEFTKLGYTLLDTVYINSKTKMNYICSNGHNQQIRWNDLDQGHRCALCVNKNIKYTYAYVKKVLSDEGFVLLSKTYVTANLPIDIVCSKGHRSAVTFSSFLRGRRCDICRKISLYGETNPNYRGGVDKLNLPLYSTYASQLEKYHKVYLIKQKGLDLLGVDCVYCGKSYVPTKSSLVYRLRSINGSVTGENNLYCSDNCKKACPTYGKKLYPEGFSPATSREVQPQLRKLVLKRDNYTCKICGVTEEQLHCHHIEPVVNNPIESADINNCITLCVECHKKVHKLPGCGYNELKCKE